MSAFFYHDDEQKKTIEKVVKILKYEVKTEISKYDKFYLAEDYHQKYNVKHKKLFRELGLNKKSNEEIVNSRMVAKLNGYLCGHMADEDEIKKEVKEWNLDEKNQKFILSELGI